MADYNNDNFNNLCVNDCVLMNMNLKKQQLLDHLKKNVNLEQRFIFVDTTDTGLVINNDTFTVNFGETLKNVVEIELMSCQIPKNGDGTGDTYNYGANYILLFLDNLDLDNYKIATNKDVSHCFEDYLFQVLL